MVELNRKQVFRVRQWVESHSLQLEDLKNELVDHISCEVELLMEEDYSFEQAFVQTIQLIPEGQLKKIEETTIYYTNKTIRIMKNTTLFSGYLVVGLFFLAFLSRIFNPAIMNDIILSAAAILSFVFVPFFFLSNYSSQEGEKNKLMHLLGFLGAFLLSASTVFKFYQIGISIYMMAAGILFLLLGFFPLLILRFKTGGHVRIARGSILFFLFLSLVGIGFYNLSISKDMVDFWLTQQKELEESNKVLDLIATDLEKGSEALIPEVKSRSDSLNLCIENLRQSYITRLDNSYKPENQYFQGMSNSHPNRGIEKLALSEKVFEQTNMYEQYLINILSEENERESAVISELLDWEAKDENQAMEMISDLFSGYPAIVNSTTLISMETSVKLSAIRTIHFLKNQNNE